MWGSDLRLIRILSADWVIDSDHMICTLASDWSGYCILITRPGLWLLIG